MQGMGPGSPLKVPATQFESIATPLTYRFGEDCLVYYYVHCSITRALSRRRRGR